MGSGGIQLLQDCGFSYITGRYSDLILQNMYSSILHSNVFLGQLIFVPLVNYFQFNEAWLMTAVFASTSLRTLVKGLASEPWMYYAGAIIDLLGAYAMSIVRSMMSCCVPPDDLGKVLAGTTFIECIVPLGIVQVYASVWKVSTVMYLQD